MHSKFKRIVVLDPIVLLDEHRQRLELLAGRAEFFPSVNAREILKRLEVRVLQNSIFIRNPHRRGFGLRESSA